jgi:hypothetical protein
METVRCGHELCAGEAQLRESQNGDSEMWS